jgi:hypothetical protein
MLDRDEPKRVAALRRLLGLLAIGNEISEQMRQEVDVAISRLLGADHDRKDLYWM